MRFFIIRVEAVEAIMFLKVIISGAFDNYFWPNSLNPFQFGTPRVSTCKGMLYNLCIPKL